MNFEEYYNYLQNLTAQVNKQEGKQPPGDDKKYRVRKRLAKKVFTGKKRTS